MSLFRTPLRGSEGVLTRSQTAELRVRAKTEENRSTTTTRSSAAARKKLEYEAAQRQALVESKLLLIERGLIEKKLEVDLAELEEKTGSVSSENMSRVSEWLAEQNGGKTAAHGFASQLDLCCGKVPYCSTSAPIDIGNDEIPNRAALRDKYAPDDSGGGKHQSRDNSGGGHDEGGGGKDQSRNRRRVLDDDYVPFGYGDVPNYENDDQRHDRGDRPTDGRTPHGHGGGGAPPGRDSVQELADTLRQVLENVPKKENNRELLARLATSKDLPVYEGDPMQWLQFKEAFYESTKLCKYSDTENVWRLRKCLRGDAKEAVSSLLIGSTTPQTIIDTLELRFGRPESIIHKIFTQLKKVPPLPTAYHTEIVNFSIKIKNYVTAVKAIRQLEYLQSPEMTSTVLAKFPAALINKWADYAYERRDSSIPKLELLAEFLYKEATIVATSGISYIHIQCDAKKKPEHTKSSYHAVCTTACSTSTDRNCQFCRSSPHTLDDCAKFKRAMRRDRWRHVRAKNLCFKCLGARHAEPSACRASDCGECGHPHHRLLHWTKPQEQQQTSPAATALPLPQPRPAATDEPRADETVTMATTTSVPSEVSPSEKVLPKVYLKVVPVTVHGPKNSIHAHALLDDGATVTLIAADLADQAGLRGESGILRVRSAWTAVSGDLVCATETVSLDISNNDGVQYNLRARKMKELNLPIERLSDIDFSKYEHLDHNFDMCMCDAQPKILIGQDNYDLIAPMICIKSTKNNQPYITKTPLGWCVHGTVNKFVTADRLLTVHGTCAPTCTECNINLVTSADANVLCDNFDNNVSPVLMSMKDHYDEGVPPREPPRGATARAACASDSTQRCHGCVELLEFVRQSFALDSIGINNKPRQNADELRAITILNKTCELVNNEWFVGLPCKYDDFVMPDSYVNSLNRLKLIEKKMAANAPFGTRYKERVEHLFSNGYARELHEGEVSDRVWYLPHFGVDNPNKAKLRLVFDAAAKAQGYSLNDFLLQGPDLLQSLLGIMFRFRENKIALIADIKDMFLRIKINEEDQHALRFLFRDNTGCVKKYLMTSLIFGANCSPFVAQFVKNKNAARFKDTHPEAVEAIHQSHYMDDYIDSLPGEEAARKMVEEVASIHKAGGFTIRNWASNVPSVLANLPKEALSENVCYSLDQGSQPERTLGLLWYPTSDELGFDLSLKRIPEDIVQLKRKPTKRQMLSIIMSIFDIHGFLGPFTINAKILLQKTWKADVAWDAELPDEFFNIFANWMEQMKAVKNVRIPRYLFDDRNLSTYSVPTCASETELLELHVFCDASPSAYAAVAYWRKKCTEGVVVSFIASKSRVAPTKLVTIPRLELQGALLACRLAEAIKREHRLIPTSTFYWTDSTTVLHWIRNENRNYKVFIANRLGEIDELSKIQEWHYVPTDLNVADLATKSNDYKLESNVEWFTGPSFLRDYDTRSWPLEPETERKISDEILERINTVHEESHSQHDLPVPEPTRFSSWLRLLRATATVLLFIEKCKKKKTEVLTDELMKRAEVLLLQHSQAKSFASDVLLLKQNKDLKLRKQWRIAQRLADHFWSRWMKEVLPTLVPRHKWRQEGTQLKPGDVVVVVDPSSPRNFWPKGIVQAVYPGADGRVRVVTVKTKSGLLKRPAARIAYLLSPEDGECREADTEGENVSDVPILCQ